MEVEIVIVTIARVLRLSWQGRERGYLRLQEPAGPLPEHAFITSWVTVRAGSRAGITEIEVTHSEVVVTGSVVRYIGLAIGSTAVCNVGR